jgi:hypothetical protein
MGFAIITEKYSGGNAKTLRSSSLPLSQDAVEQANALDRYLGKRIPAIELGLITTGLLDEKIPAEDSAKSRGNVRLWHALGTKLREICQERRVSGIRERRWLWEAIEKLHATERIKRAARGRTRSHFEYCYRLSRFPLSFAEKLNWAEWVYFFDSRTVREEQRIDEWLKSLVEGGERVGRIEFRPFTEGLNKRLRKIDTSVLSDAELFSVYDETWKVTKASQSSTETEC